MPGNEMVERCLFYGTNIYDRRFSINDGIEFPFLVFPVSAESSFPIADDTFPRTEKTLNVLAIRFLIEQGFFRRGNRIYHQEHPKIDFNKLIICNININFQLQLTVMTKQIIILSAPESARLHTIDKIQLQA
jgi:hypothetical protein